MDVTSIDPSKVRDISAEVLDARGRLRVLPAAYWATTTVEERYLFGHRHGLYSFPTVELVEHLREIIAGRSAIEIGAGHGALAEALGIPATDNREQERPENRLLIALQSDQAPVSYGPDVIECHASRAVRRFKPEVVVGCWVTQRWNGRQDDVDSKPDGVDEDDILRHCQLYVLVGNEQVHQNKRIWRKPHTIEYLPFAYSRAINGSREFIATWQGVRPQPVQRRSRKSGR